MNMTKLPFLLPAVILLLLALPLQSAETNKRGLRASIFNDKKLEEAVRKYVFEKRDSDKPITAEDVVSLSTISATGLGIKDLTGLEKCASLASLDLARNSI